MPASFSLALKFPLSACPSGSGPKLTSCHEGSNYFPPQMRVAIILQAVRDAHSSKHRARPDPEHPAGPSLAPCLGVSCLSFSAHLFRACFSPRNEWFLYLASISSAALKHLVAPAGVSSQRKELPEERSPNPTKKQQHIPERGEQPRNHQLPPAAPPLLIPLPFSSTTRVKMSLLLFACHFVADLMTIDNS